MLTYNKDGIQLHEIYFFKPVRLIQDNIAACIVGMLVNAPHTLMPHSDDVSLAETEYDNGEKTKSKAKTDVSL